MHMNRMPALPAQYMPSLRGQPHGLALGAPLSLTHKVVHVGVNFNPFQRFPTSDSILTAPGSLNRNFKSKDLSGGKNTNEINLAKFYTHCQPPPNKVSLPKKMMHRPAPLSTPWGGQFWRRIIYPTCPLLKDGGNDKERGKISSQIMSPPPFLGGGMNVSTS